MSLPSDPVSETKDIVLAIAALVVFGVFGWLVWSRGEWKSEATQYKDEIAAYQTANNQCVADVAAAKKNLADAVAAGQLRANAAADAVSDSTKKQAASLFANASSIVALQPAANDDCAAAKEVAQSYFRGAK